MFQLFRWLLNLSEIVIPQVNSVVAKCANSRNIPVFQDLGGDDREMSSEHLKNCYFVSPNETELQRLTGMPTGTFEEVLSVHIFSFTEFLGYYVNSVMCV